MIVVDTSALVAVMWGEPEAYAFAQAIKRAEPALIAAPTRLEAWIVCWRTRGEQEARDLEQFIERAAIVTIPFDEILLDAALTGFSRFGRGRGKANLNYGDCFSYALAKSRGLPLLFKGDDFTHTDIEAAV